MRAVFVILLSTVVACSLFVSSCSDSTTTTEIKLKTLEGRVKVSIHEGYSGYGVVEDPGIFLSLLTEQMQPCMNWSIETVVERNGNRILVWLEGISTPQICATAIGPATEWKGLQLEDGNYQLGFVLNGQIDTYTLDINDSAIVLEPIEADFTYSDNLKFWRYPKNSFACLFQTTDPQIPLVIEFADSLQNLSGVKEIQLGQQFALPYYVDNRYGATTSVVKVYGYEAEEHFASAGTLMQRFVNRQSLQHGWVSMQLTNWRGEQYLSWMMD